MKQGKSIFLLLAMALMLLSGCTDKSPALVKTWKMQDFKYSREIPKDMQPAIDRSLNEMRNSFSLTYNADGTYTTKMNNNVLHGKWKLNWNSSKITSTTAQGEQKDYSIIELTDSKLSFEAMEGKDNVIFVMVAAK
jgi:hypothetical protein